MQIFTKFDQNGEFITAFPTEQHVDLILQKWKTFPLPVSVNRHLLATHRSASHRHRLNSIPGTRRSTCHSLRNRVDNGRRSRLLSGTAIATAFAVGRSLPKRRRPPKPSTRTIASDRRGECMLSKKLLVGPRSESECLGSIRAFLLRRCVCRRLPLFVLTTDVGSRRRSFRF